MRRFGPARADSGSVTPMVIIMAIGIMLAIGMAWDGGGGLDAERRANNIAEEAARAGATAVDVQSYLATGVARMDRTAATANVQTFCRQYASVQVTCTPIFNSSLTEIQVNVSIVRNIVFLPSAVGKTVYGHAQVKLTQGVTDAGG